MFRLALFAMSLYFVGGSLTASAQLSSASIEAAYQYSARNSGIGMIVKERGKTRFERYYNGHSQKQPLHIYSGTKSFFGVLGVIAQDEGILSLDERVAETLPEWREDPRKSQITIRDLLNSTSGLERGYRQIYGRSNADKLTLSVGLAATRARGESFFYGPSHLQVFCEVLRRKLKARGMTYESYLDRKLIRPLGITITQWRGDAHGNKIPSAGMWMTGRDWLKFGEMVSRGGTWKGRSLVRSNSLATCFESTPINPMFGLCFWLNSYREQDDAREIDVETYLDVEPYPEDWSRACLSKNAPTDLVASIGSNFQRLYVVPSMDLVIIHLGKKGNSFRDAEFLGLLFSDSEGAKTPSSGAKQRNVTPLFPKGLFKRPGQ